MAAQLPGTLLVPGSKVPKASSFRASIKTISLATNFHKTILTLAMVFVVIGLPACAFGKTSGATQNCYGEAKSAVRIKKITMETMNGRTLPLEMVHPDAPGKYPLVIFSHGAFASPNRYYALLKPVAAAGYIVLAPRHLDSEDWDRKERPSQTEIWESRGEDMSFIISPNSELAHITAKHGIILDYEHIAAMGHSYGALIAQIAAGARAILPTPLNRNPSVKAVIALSPPGITPNLIDKNGWERMFVPSLTITGTADILPGFIDDWKQHKHSYDFAPTGQRWLWVGEGVDHYFGGMIGREKPAPKKSKALFERSVATTISFLDAAMDKPLQCALDEPISGEKLIKD
ncbi:MAG: hypothetical protein ABJP02_07630 [Parasphingorhabdus sp.]|uniref:alpha/beta hydrolase family protein n=1 Tax=Parasphingorhabdus sp. TaxID=2709688 RepID=UPI0032981488